MVIIAVLRLIGGKVYPQLFRIDLDIIFIHKDKLSEAAILPRKSCLGEIQDLDILRVADISRYAVKGFEIPEIPVYSGEERQKPLMRQKAVPVKAGDLSQVYLADEPVFAYIAVLVSIFRITVSRRKVGIPPETAGTLACLFCRL